MEHDGRERGTDFLELIGKHRRCIMGVAALLIFAFHKHTLLCTEGRFLFAIESQIKRIAFVGVDIFLLLSGISMTYAIRKEKIGTFYFRRLKRIALPFLVIGAIVAVSEHWSAAAVFGNLSGYYFFTKSMYSFLWFFPAIAVFYLLFPLYHLLLKRSGSPMLFTGIVLCMWLLGSMLLSGPMKTAGREEFYGFTNRIPIFVIGILFGEMGQERKRRIPWLGWVLIVLMNMLGLYLAYQTSYQKMQLLVPVPNCCIPNILLSISLTCILAKLFDLLNRARLLRLLRRGFELFGIISLELYAVQRIVMVSWTGIFPWTSVPALKNLTLLILTTAAATALYWLNRGFWMLLALPFKKQRKNDRGNEG